MASSSQRIFEKIFFGSALFFAIGFFLIGVINPARFGGIFLGLGGLLYAYCLYRSGFVFRNILREFHPIAYLLLSYCGIIAMALISIHFAFDAKETLKAILIFLIFPLIVALGFYFVVKNFPLEPLRFFLILLGVVIFAHPVATIYDYWSLHPERATGFGDILIIPYSMVLILSFALSMAMLLCLRGKWQFVAVLGIALSLFAMYANGTRALILSVGTMVFVALFFLRKNKKIIIPLVLVLGIGGSVIGIAASSHLNERLNFKKILDHISVVWEYPPAAMGRFDVLCFGGSAYRCSKFSGDKIDSQFTFESSALNRLSMIKSTLIYIAKNPFRPNGFGAKEFYKNFSQNISIDSKEHMYITLNYKNLDFIPYTHMNSMIISWIFELGVVGFGFICISLLMLIKFVYSARNNFDSSPLKLVFPCFLIFFAGFFVAMFFDVMLAYSNFNYLFFILIGVALGVASRKTKIVGENEH